LLLLSQGFTNREIAQRLGITISTTRWRIHRAFVKLGARNRIEAIERARRAQQWLHGTAIDPPGSTPEPPKPVEVEIMRLLGHGMKRKEIADSLALPLASVKWYMNGIYGKLKARNRVEALARARQFDWL
jgi:DNA-binding NarL/FixJ family response regulator